MKAMEKGTVDLAKRQSLGLSSEAPAQLNGLESVLNKPMDRRKFLETTGAIGAGVGVATAVPSILKPLIRGPLEKEAGLLAKEVAPVAAREAAKVGLSFAEKMGNLKNVVRTNFLPTGGIPSQLLKATTEEEFNIIAGQLEKRGLLDGMGGATREDVQAILNHPKLPEFEKLLQETKLRDAAGLTDQEIALLKENAKTPMEIENLLNGSVADFSKNYTHDKFYRVQGKHFVNQEGIMDKLHNVVGGNWIKKKHPELSELVDNEVTAWGSQVSNKVPKLNKELNTKNLSFLQDINLVPKLEKDVFPQTMQKAINKELRGYELDYDHIPEILRNIKSKEKISEDLLPEIERILVNMVMSKDPHITTIANAMNHTTVKNASKYTQNDINILARNAEDPRAVRAFFNGPMKSVYEREHLNEHVIPGKVKWTPETSKLLEQFEVLAWGDGKYHWILDKHPETYKALDHILSNAPELGAGF